METQGSYNWSLAPWLVIKRLRISMLLHVEVGVQGLLENHPGEGTLCLRGARRRFLGACCCCVPVWAQWSFPRTVQALPAEMLQPRGQPGGLEAAVPLFGCAQ